MRRVEYGGEEYLIFTRSGWRLIDSLRERGVPVECDCKGDQSSAKCAVKFPKDTAFLLTAPTPLERKVLGPEKLEKGFRLACQALWK